MASTHDKYALIGAGPAGLSGARNLQRFGIPFDGFDLHSDVGGLWDIANPHSTMYQSAHLISSKKMTEFHEFPIGEEVADYPRHSDMRKYFQDFARHFSLYQYYHFNTQVVRIEPEGELWNVTIQRQDANSEPQTYPYKGVLIANGTLSEPNIPEFTGEFSGELLHSASYKTPEIFSDKRVLIVGAGNSGCDIVIDAVHRAKQVDLSVRRGYHFVPKYVFGRPADAIGGKVKLPFKLKQFIDSRLLKIFTGDPEKFGFPPPDHKLYESHPIVNSLVLHHLGHGDLQVKGDIEKFAGHTVHFQDGTSQEYDMVMLATGYKLHYPFIDNKHLNWNGKAPCLHLNAFHPEYDNLFVLGMVEAAGLGWEGRYQQAELVARFIKGLAKEHPQAKKLQQEKKHHFPDLRGGAKYMEVDRMVFYVHKDTYMKQLRRYIRRLQDV